jgi:hypothetical protein
MAFTGIAFPTQSRTQALAIIGIAQRQLDHQPFSCLIDGDAELEAKEPVLPRTATFLKAGWRWNDG